MMQHSDSNPIELDLIALEDGELDVAGLRRVEQYLAQQAQAAGQAVSPAVASDSASNSINPDHLRTLLLKAHISQTMRAQIPATPAALKNQIAQMLGSAAAAGSTAATQTPPTLKLATAASPAAQARPVVSRWLLASRWAPAGIAAMLLVGILLTQTWQTGQRVGQQVGLTPSKPAVASSTGSSASNSSSNPTQSSPSIFNHFTSLTNQSSNSSPIVLTTSPQAPVAYAQMSPDRISAFGNRHSMCSKKLEQLHRSSEFPREVAKMPQAIAGCIGKMPKGSLDLSQAGYQFSRAGECRIPGLPAVHLVYRNAALNDSVSLWVVSYTGKPQLAQGTLYQGDPADSDHPIFFFRQDDLVYYLVGNAFDHTRVAAQKLVYASR